ncbi:MAG TPA: nuclear transport factor 2 family protein [Albitalea sp.]|nr:nuclear transport factor 2 family protein [Albitalea sp.]
MATSLNPTELEDLLDQRDIVDTLYRFGAGQDLHDEALLASAFADDAELDFAQPAARLGVALPVMVGKAAIVPAIVAATSQLDTTHTVSNPRVQRHGHDEAELFALVEAQHLPQGDHVRHLLLKNIYRCRLRRTSQGWRITRMHIHNVWLTGDPNVLFA